MLTDEELTRIYKKANGEDVGKAQPLTTQRIFTAMRAIEAEATAPLLARIAELEKELETERMRLAACGVVAMANTRESAEKARQMHPDYMSASCQDVMRAVDAEMGYRERIAELEADAKRLDFVEGRLFGKSWNGVIDSGSRTDWRIASDYRHTTQKMVGHTFRDALDNAMKEQP